MLRYPVISVVSVLACAALFLSTRAYAESSVLSLRLEVRTTAKWTRIEPAGLHWRITGHRVEVSGGAEASAGVQGGAIWLRKASADSRELRVSLVLAAVPTGDPIHVAVTRDDAGKSDLRLLAGRLLLAQDHSQGPTGVLGNQRLLEPDLKEILSGPTLPRRDWGRRVLAFYYGWWGRPDGPAREWLHWNPAEPHHDVTHEPALGHYDSADPKVVEQHVLWAKQAGIDTLVLSWWRAYPHQQLVLKLLLDACQRHGLTVAIYLEQCENDIDLKGQLQSLLAGMTQHPAWLTVHGQKVVFLYTRIFDHVEAKGLAAALAGLPILAIGDRLEPAWLEVLGGLHSYVSFLFPAKRMDQMRAARQAARLWDKLAVATVMPAYDDTNIRFGGRHISRDEGRYLDAQWAAATPMDWVILTSFNELHEGSEMEPTTSDGDRWLKAMRAHVDQWKAGAP